MAEFSVPIDVFAERAKMSIGKAVRHITLDIATRIIMRSPVDTGRFRANWNVAQGQPDRSTTELTDASSEGVNSRNSAAAKIQSYAVGGVVYITNSLPYAGVIEFGGYPNPPKAGSKKRKEDAVAVHVIGGYSMQAPQGVVRVSLLETRANIRKIVALKGST